jgi:RNA polymerase sigma factor (TIGR02999 family)
MRGVVVREATCSEARRVAGVESGQLPSQAPERALGCADMSDEPVSPDRVTRLLLEWSDGDERARDEMLPLVYNELRRLAVAYLLRERRDHTLRPTELVHEAYLRLIDQRQVDWKNRAQFVGLAAVMMRRILVNHARERLAAKRGGGAQKVPLSAVDPADDPPDVDVLALHDALERLAAVDARKSRIVELKFFGGLTTSEIAEVLDLSPATIERDWSFARAWLYDAVAGDR